MLDSIEGQLSKLPGKSNKEVPKVIDEHPLLLALKEYVDIVLDPPHAYDSYSGYDSKRKALKRIEEIQKRFGVSLEAIEQGKEFQKFVRGRIIQKIDKVRFVYDLNIIETQIADLFFLGDVYSLPEFKMAARRAINHIDFQFATSLPDFAEWFKKFDHTVEELRSDVNFQKKAQNSILFEMKSYGLTSSEINNLITAFGIPDDWFASTEFQNALKVYVFKLLPYGSNDEILEMRRVFRINNKQFEDFVFEFIVHNYDVESMSNFFERLYKTNTLPREFFAKPEIMTKLSEELLSTIMAGGIDQALDMMNKLGLGEEIYHMIEDLDRSHSYNFTYLGFDKGVLYLNGIVNKLERLPMIKKKMIKLIVDSLPSNFYLGSYFISFFDAYFEQPWAKEVLLKVVKESSLAVKFYNLAQQYKTSVWAREPWVVEVLEKIKANNYVPSSYAAQYSDKSVNDDVDDYPDTGAIDGEEGFMERDPYENHEWRLVNNQLRLSSGFARIMSGEDVQEIPLELEDGPEKVKNKFKVTPELGEGLKLINQKIEKGYKIFLERVRLNSNIPEEDKSALLNPESTKVKMTSLLQNIRMFCARYIVQRSGGSMESLNNLDRFDYELGGVLEVGFRKYVSVYEIDIPLYDKLYAEFDELRHGDHPPLEVYLGRDGVYAWMGRRAQDVARRRKMGLAGRKKLKDAGMALEIHPKYVVYPSRFRDNLNKETKKLFLTQEGITPENNPLFFDTGFSGSIPEQIMRIMGFKTGDIDSRIRLLSAHNARRRARFLTGDVDDDTVHAIENNAKNEESAEGLVVDEKTGKIRHVAQPTNPEDQFSFEMIKQAVTRHYWLQEQLHYKAPKDVAEKTN